jgi:hypothetical protein
LWGAFFFEARERTAQPIHKSVTSHKKARLAESAFPEIFSWLDVARVIAVMKPSIALPSRRDGGRGWLQLRLEKENLPIYICGNF